MKEITEAIEARQAQITQLQGDIETLSTQSSTNLPSRTRPTPIAPNATACPVGAIP